MTENLKEEQIIEISQSAIDKIAELIESRETDGLAVRVAIRGALPGGGFQTEFKFIQSDEKTDSDLVQETGSFELVIGEDVAAKVSGAKVDFDEDRYSAGFNIEYPKNGFYPPGVEARTDWEDPLAQQVQLVIDEYINPGVAGHGGWVLLKDVKEKKAYVEMGGGCQGCGLSAMTLRQGIEDAIKQAVPDIEEIVDLTDHDEGETPYYSAEAAEAMGGASPFTK